MSLRMCLLLAVAIFLGGDRCCLPSAVAQQDASASAKQKKPKKKQPPFQWVNPLKSKLPGVQHQTFRSESMELEVGYCIYLPKAYTQLPERRFPVVYYLHGGRPGSETKSVRLANFIHEHIESGELVVRKSGGAAPVEYFRIKMENIMISSYSTGGSKDGLDRIQENLTLNFRKFEITYTLQEASGAAGAEALVGWDIAKNAEWSS